MCNWTINLKVKQKVKATNLGMNTKLITGEFDGFLAVLDYALNWLFISYSSVLKSIVF
jgi:hypothetical protein